MTPTEQGDDRAKLIIEMSNLLHRHFQAQRKATVEAFANAQGDLVNFITANRKRVVLEARIDELEQVYPQLQKHHGVSGEGNYYYDDRIAELKAQQEEFGDN